MADVELLDIIVEAENDVFSRKYSTGVGGLAGRLTNLVSLKRIAQKGDIIDVFGYNNTGGLIGNIVQSNYSTAIISNEGVKDVFNTRVTGSQVHVGGLFGIVRVTANQPSNALIIEGFHTNHVDLKIIPDNELQSNEDYQRYDDENNNGIHVKRFGGIFGIVYTIKTIHTIKLS